MTALGGAAAAAAVVSFVRSGPTAATLAAFVALVAAATLAEAFPLPLEGRPAGDVSLAAVFVVGTALLYGWAAGTLVALATRVALELARRRPPIRIAYNGAMYGLAGAATGVAVDAVDGDSVGSLVAAAVVGSAAFSATTILLAAAAASRSGGEPFAPLVARAAYWTTVPFAITASVTLMLAVLWQRSPVLAVALAGPLLAIVLYQRSVHRALAAMRLALTDPLTGLGNHRHFHERLQAGLDRAERAGSALTLCLVDVDDFKRINDRHGHPAGDHVLVDVARSLRQGGESFRLGGDEFAVVLPGLDQVEGLAVAEAIAARLETVPCGDGETVSVSVGVASYPSDGAVDRNELVRLADDALYRAKREGKHRVRAHTMPRLVEASPERTEAAG